VLSKNKKLKKDSLVKKEIKRDPEVGVLVTWWHFNANLIDRLPCVTRPYLPFYPFEDSSYRLVSVSWRKRDED
jgi:hypothetical protein